MPVRGMSEQQTERINPLLQETDREKESLVFLFSFFFISGFDREIDRERERERQNGWYLADNA